MDSVDLWEALQEGGQGQKPAHDALVKSKQTKICSCDDCDRNVEFGAFKAVVIVLHDAFTFNETKIWLSKSGYPENEVDIYIGMIDVRNEEILTDERANGLDRNTLKGRREESRPDIQ